jgi:hypothetical protein
MRSQPPPSPSALPPILDDLATILPLPKKAYRSKDDSDIPLADLDPETSRLIQPKRRTHRVWVQGRLAAVRTVSNKLRRKGSGLGKDAVDPDLVSGKVSSRRSLEEDLEQVDEEAEHETEMRARQLRGYGIGGIGNIRELTPFFFQSLLRPLKVVREANQHPLSKAVPQMSSTVRIVQLPLPFPSPNLDSKHPRPLSWTSSNRNGIYAISSL